jgi:opine dehydrogenase
LERNISEKPIAILGGGATGQTFAADLALAGRKVRLYELPEFAPKSLGDVLKTHEIELTGPQLNFKWIKRVGTAKIDMVTTDISEALRGAGLVIVSIPAIGHKKFFEKMIPHLEDGQVVSIFADNFGSLPLREMMHEKSCDVNVVIGGWSTMPYGTRVIRPGKVECLSRIYKISWDTLPSKDGDRFLEAFKDFPPLHPAVKIERADTVIAVGFNNPNPVVHVPGSILNVGAMEVSESEGTLGIEKGKFSMYKYGMSPAVSRVQYAFYQELRKIADTIGIKITEYHEEQFYTKLSVMGVEFQNPFGEAIIPSIVGPLSVEDRYFTEDIPVGTVAYYNFAKKFGVDVPAIESLIRLGCIICRRDFFKEGRSLKEMGLEDMTKEQMLRYVREGIR